MAYNTPKDSGTTRIVAITGVDAAARTATGITRERSVLNINCAYPVGGLIVTPAVGEQWYVQRVGIHFTLLQRLPGNSKELQVDATEGQVQVGSSGPLTLHGSEVQVQSNLKLGETLYRDTDGTLENSIDEGATWTEIKGSGGGGAVASVAGKTGIVQLTVDDISELDSRLRTKADLVSGIVPDAQLPPPRVRQYTTSAAFPATGATNTIYLAQTTKEIYIWGGAAYVAVGGGIASTPGFFDGFNPTGGTLASQIIAQITDLAGGSLSGLSSVLSGLGSMATQIVEKITGIIGGTLADLGNFFDGFDIFSGTNTLVKQFVDAILGSGTGLTGALGQLQTFFGGITGTAGSLIQQVVQAIVGPFTGNLDLAGLTKFFSNFRTLFDGINFLAPLSGTGAFTAGGALATFVSSLTGTGLLASVSSLLSWFTINGDTNNIQRFFTNVRKFLGSINFLGPIADFNPVTAAGTFISMVLEPTNLIGTVGKLLDWLTVDGSANFIQTFFTNMRSFFGGINLLPRTGGVSTAFGATQIAAAATTFINNILKPTGILTAVNDLLDWVTVDGSANFIQVFFTRLRGFFGIDFLPRIGGVLQNYDGAASLTSFITKLKTAGLAAISDIISWVTVDGSANIIQIFFTNLRKLFGFGTTGSLINMTSALLNEAAITTAIRSFIDNVLKPQNILATISGIQADITGSITGSISTVFNNLRKLFGMVDGNGTVITSGVGSLLDGSFNVVTVAKNFIEKVLALSGGKFVLGNLPTLVMSNISNWATEIAKYADISTLVQKVTGFAGGTLENLGTFFSGFDVFNPASPNGLASQLTKAVTGTAGALSTIGTFLSDTGALFTSYLKKIFTAVTGISVYPTNLIGEFTKFFTNVRSFLGIDFLPKLSGLDLTFDPLAAVGTFLGKLRTAGVTVMTDLLDWFTKDGDTNAIQRFFTNLRKLFGGSLFDPTAGWTPINVINNLINAINSSVGAARINIGKIAQLAINDVSGLFTSLGLKADISGLVQQITGAAGTALSEIGTFFSGFVTGNPGTLMKKIVSSITGTEGALSTIGTFLSDTGALFTSYINKIFTAITGISSAAALTDLTRFFTNIRSFLGIDFLPKLSGLNVTFDPVGAVTSFVNTLRSRGVAAVTDLTDWFTKDGSANVIQVFFTNLRKLFGNSFFDQTLGWTPINVINNLINNINSSVGAARINIGKIAQLAITDISGLFSTLNLKADIGALVQKITGIVGGTLDNLGGFFSGFDIFNPASPNSLVSQLTTAIMGSPFSLANLKKFFEGFDLFNPTSNNSLVKQISNAVTGVGTFTSTTLEGISSFFKNVRSIFGAGFDFTKTPAQFVASLGGGLDTFIDNLLGRSKLLSVANMQTWLGTTSLAGITTFFTNLQKLLSGVGLFNGAVGAGAFNALEAGATFINNIFGKSNIATSLTNLNSSKIPGLTDEMLAKTDTATLVQKITGQMGATDLTKVGQFFAGFDPFSSTNTLIQQIVNQITGGANLASLKTFFDNLKGNLTSLFGSGFLNSLLNGTALSSAIQNFITAALAPANAIVKKFATLGPDNLISIDDLPRLTIDVINDVSSWVDESIIGPVIAAMTGLPGLPDLAALGVWARNLLGRNSPIPAINIMGQISSAVLGIIPVSHVAQVSPNLLSQGAFGSVTNIEAGNGWTWDENENRTDTGGSAKVSITSAALRQLFSRQTIPVTAGDRIDVSAYVKTLGLVGTSTHVVSLGSPTAGSFRLTYGGLTTISLDRLATASTVQTELQKLVTIGTGKATVTGSAGGPYTIVITGSANKLTGTPTFTGGNFSITSTCPVTLSLTPFIGSARQPEIVLNTTGGNASWTPLVGPTYTVTAESGYTSVLVTLGVSAAATAGSVWWDDISLSKSGALKQTLVDRLTDAWDNLWNGVFGLTGVGKAIGVGVDALTTLANTIAGAAGTAAVNGLTAIKRIGDLAVGLLTPTAQVLGSLANIAFDAVGNSVQQFLDFVGHAFDKDRRQSGLGILPGKTVNDIADSANLVTDVTYLTNYSTNTQSDYWNTPRVLPAWLGNASDDVSFAMSLIDSGTTPVTNDPPLNRLVLIPVTATQNRTYDSLKFGMTVPVGGATMTSLYAGIYDVDETTGATSKILDLGNIKSQLNTSYSLQTISLPEPRGAQRGELFYIGLMQVGGTPIQLHKWSASNNFTTGQFPKFIGNIHTATFSPTVPTGSVSNLPATVAQSDIIAGSKYWGALGVATPNVAPPSIFHSDSFDRTTGMGPSWTQRYGTTGISSGIAFSQTASLTTYVGRLGSTSQGVGARIWGSPTAPGRGGNTNDFWSALLSLRGNASGGFVYLVPILSKTYNSTTGVSTYTKRASIYTASTYAQPGANFGGGSLKIAGTTFTSSTSSATISTPADWFFTSISSGTTSTYIGYHNNVEVVRWTDTNSAGFPYTASNTEVGIGSVQGAYIDNWYAKDL